MTYSNVLTPSNTTLVRESPARTGPQIPACEMHARRIAREAEAWLALATARTNQHPATLRSKAFNAATFSVARKATSLAIPSKLVGVSHHQRQLWTMVREQTATWSVLDIEDTGDGLAISYDGEPVGEIQPKHLGWARPLMSFGLRLYLSRITGTDRDRATLGCNVVFGHVGDAVGRLTDALAGLSRPTDVKLVSMVSSGDGATGEAPRALFGPPAIRLQAERGDGAPESADGLSLVVASGVPVRDEHEALTGSADDVVLFRRVDGTACMSIPHIVTHSPTGVDWGAKAGRAGMADFASSVLVHVADAETADALATLFVEGVVSRLPYRGGVIRAGDVQLWIQRSTAGSR